MSEVKYTAQKKYFAKTIKRVYFNLNSNTDQDIIAHLEHVDNVQGYLKRLVRNDMKKDSGNAD